MSVNVRFKIGQKKGITANYNVSNEEPIKTIFRINAPSAAFSSITGSPYDNANLKAALDAKADKSELDANIAAVDETINDLETTVTNNYNTLDNKIDDVQSDLSGGISTLETEIQNEATTRAENDTLLQGDINTLRNDLTAEINNRATADTTLQGNINNIQNTINNYGDIVSYDASDFATYAQGQKADSALQPNDNISELVNDVGYITSASLPTVNNSSIVFQKNGTGFDTITLNQANNDTINITVPTQTSELTNNSGFITASALDGYATENFVTSQGYITGINESDVLDALGYTPYNASNPDGFITGITSNDVITALGYTPYNSTNPSGYQANVIESIKVNNTTQTVVNKTVNITVPTTAAEVGALPDTTTINDLTTAAQQAALNSGATTTNIGQIATNTGDISTINGKIPAQASSSNQLADKNFVNSSVQTATANFRGNWNDWAAVPSVASDYPEDYAGNKTPTVNDYLVVQDASDYTQDTLEGTWRFKYTGDWSTDGKSGWIPEYQVNETPLTAAQLAALNSGITANDVTLIGTALQPNDNISELTNNTGYITGINQADVIDALGYTPYNSTNPDGYITASDLPTNYVTTDTAQDISGRKTFIGEKAIYFKQSAAADKLGFTLYNASSAELGAMEWRPNTINGNALFNLNCSQSGSNYVGFRYWSGINIVAPRPTTNGNYFIPTHITNSTLTVTANNTGTVDISTLLPDVSNFVTNSSLATTLADYTLSSSLATVATSGSYNDLSDKPTIPTVPTNISAFTNDSGYITSSALNSYQPLLVSGTNIKTINNTSLLGNGDIDTSEVFIAEYGTTTFSEVLTAYNANKVIFCYDDNNNTYAPITNYTGTDFYFSTGLINNISASYTLDDNDTWDGGDITLAAVATSGSYNDLSNKPTIPSAQVQANWNETDTNSMAYIQNKPNIPSGVVVDQTYDGTSVNAQSGIAMAGELANYTKTANLPLTPYYATSTTAADTATKVVSIPAITTLNVGQIICVKPTITSTVATSKIKLNNFTAYNMRYNGANITTSTDSVVWNENWVSWFVFDGTYWQFAGHGYDNNTNTTYSAMSVSEGTTGTATSARTMRADYLKQIIANLTGNKPEMDDTTPSTTTVYSSQKVQDLIDALTARIMALEANINGGNA